MKVSELINELEHVKKEHGDIVVQLQSNPDHPAGKIVGDDSVFVAAEDYPPETDGMTCNIRSWPY